MKGEVIQILENWRSFVDLARKTVPSMHIEEEMLRHLEICEMIIAILRDNDRCQVKQEGLRLWLKRVGKVAYYVHEAIDEVCYKIPIPHLHQPDTNGNNTASLPNNSSAFYRKLSRKISSINQMLNELFKRRSWSDIRWTLDFTSSLLQKKDLTSSSRERQNRLTSSYIDGPSTIVGRKDDTRKMIDMLLPWPDTTSSSSVNLTPYRENPAVIPIVGLVGVGKTTLAQLVYNNERVRQNFDLSVWVCLSDDEFDDIPRILTHVLECITGKKYHHTLNLDSLVCKVQECLSGKKYLLVLDNLSSDNAEEWEKLKILLQIDVHQGSKILVTTRNNKVASLVGGSIPPYSLQRLSEEECRSIIRKKAFSPGGAIETPNMLEIAKDLARLCRGLPVTAVDFGGFLHNKDETSWLSLRDGDMSSVYSRIIFPGMMFKYDDLPLHLKTIFSYFSIFTQDQKLQRDFLILLWMAEGFIKLSDETNEMSMEDIGKQYLDSLLGSQILEDAYIEKDESGRVKSIHLDELTHLLSREVAEDCATVEVTDGGDIYTSQVRRLRLVCDKEVKSISSDNLHTLVGIQGLKRKQIAKVLSNNKHLRVLELRNCSLGMLPDLSKLIHLRYLDLSNCQNVFLGQSISSLWYLQTLVLRGCGSLKELPRDIGSLKNLRYLDLSYTGITDLPDSRTGLQSLQESDLSNSQPQLSATDFGALAQLRHLNVSSTDIKTLPNTITFLSNLKTLKLDGCRYLEVLPSDFGKLTQLNCLDLSGTRIKELHDSTISGLCNIETLKLGHCKLPKEVGHLKSLKHIIFEGDKFETPRGIQHLTGLQTLQQFVARDGKKSNGGGIGDLEELNLLKGKIKICKLENVQGKKDAERANLKAKRYLRSLELHWSSRSINSKHSSKDDTVLNALYPHPDLEILKITNFTGSKIPQWMGDSVSSHIPKLEELVLTECNQWKQLPTLGQLSNLKVLSIHGMNSVKFLGNELYGGESSGSGNAPTRPFPSLVELTLSSMGNLEDCPAPESGMPPFPILEKLTVTFCNKLKVLQTPFTSLKELKLQHCQNLEALPYIKYLKSLKRFTVKDCMKLKLSPDDLKHVLATALLSIDRPVPAF